MSIKDNFPLEKPRASQVNVMDAIEEAFNKGFKNVLVEAPVGSGKSAIAVACAKFYGDAHILTPRKSLQDQYLEDFHKDSLVTMKGRNSYPCTYISEDNAAEYEQAVHKIRNGKVLFVSPSQSPCSEGPCLTSPDSKRKCTQPDARGVEAYPCPYHVAIDTAQKENIIVHNLHSFIFQTYYSGRFVKRELLVIDEAHQVEGILRGFAEKKFSIPLFIKNEDEPVEGQFTTLEQWSGWLSQFSEKFSTRAKSNEVSPRQEFENLLMILEDLSETIGTKFVVTIDRDPIHKRSKFTFIPEYVGGLVDKYILNFGEKRLLMSGTIVDKNLYCRVTGLKQEETCFIKVSSSFPKENRPIYLKSEYTVDISHKMWDQNFRQMVTNIKKVMEIFHDVKGIIHTPSYMASLTVYNALKDTGRVVKHDKDNFSHELSKFYDSDKSSVFISPICAEGIDLKEDRARWQIILRVPYPSTADPLMAKMVKENFTYYNYRTLVTFGQMLGRVNRSETDYGATILMDSRFVQFIARNKSLLPKWVLEAIIYS